MVKHFKILLIAMALILGLFVFASPLQADETTDPYPFVYLFHLYYDNGQLVADRDFEFKYDLIAEPFVHPALSTATPYNGEVVSISGKSLGIFQFDPTVARGKISVKGPYFSNAAKVNFYNNNGELLLTLSVSDSSVCNENGVCNSDVGEDYNNCSADCPPPVEPPADSGGPSRNIMLIIGGIIAAIVIWIVWIIIKRRKSGGSALPPSMPTTLPSVTPPVPPQVTSTP